MFITCLSMGISGWRELLKSRESLFLQARDALSKLEHFKLLSTEQNPISCALVSVNRRKTFANYYWQAFDSDLVDAKEYGSMLFTRGLTGHRVCCRSEKSSMIEGSSLVNWVFKTK